MWVAVDVYAVGRSAVKHIIGMNENQRNSNEITLKAIMIRKAYNMVTGYRLYNKIGMLKLLFC